MVTGFTGSRSLPAAFASLVRRAVAGLAGPLAVGCASGADALVRSAGGSRARVFRASSFRRPGVSFVAALVARSAALVSAVAASPGGGRLVGFVVGPCPAAVSPSPSVPACFPRFRVLVRPRPRCPPGRLGLLVSRLFRPPGRRLGPVAAARRPGPALALLAPGGAWRAGGARAPEETGLIGQGVWGDLAPNRS